MTARIVFLAAFLGWLAGCAWIDLRTRRIPWPLSYGGLLLGAWGAFLYPHTLTDWLFMAFLWVLPLGLWLKKREGIGGADVRLIWAISLVSPWAALAGLVLLTVVLLGQVLYRLRDPAVLALYLQALSHPASLDELGGPLVPMAPAVALGAAIYVLWISFR